MADRLAMDTSELNALAADLTAAGSGIAGVVRPIVHKGAINIKKQQRRDALASPHFKGFASSIDYSMHGGMIFGTGIIEAEIGPRSGPGNAGALANIAYFGGATGGGTVTDPGKALEAEQPNFERALLDAIGKLL